MIIIPYSYVNVLDYKQKNEKGENNDQMYVSTQLAAASRAAAGAGAVARRLGRLRARAAGAAAEASSAG